VRAADVAAQLNSSKRSRSSTLGLLEMNSDKAQVAAMDLEAGLGGGGEAAGSSSTSGASGPQQFIFRRLDIGGLCGVAYELWRRIRMEVVVEVGSELGAV